MSEHVYERILRRLVTEKLHAHPWPWSYSQDWTHEVHDQKGAIVSKFQTAHEAETFIAIARNYFREDAAAALELDRLLSDPTNTRPTRKDEP